MKKQSTENEGLQVGWCRPIWWLELGDSPLQVSRRFSLATSNRCGLLCCTRRRLYAVLCTWLLLSSKWGQVQ